MTPQTLAERLKQARERARYSQQDAAFALELTGAALSQYESAKRRVDAQFIDRAARLYAVPVAFFYGEESPVSQWENELHRKSETLPLAAKRGVSQIIARVHALEQLFEVAERDAPKAFRSPYEALENKQYRVDEIDAFSENTRDHYGLGMAPVADMRAFLEAVGFYVFSANLGADTGLSGLYFQHPTLGSVVIVNEDQALTRHAFTLAHEFAHGLYHYNVASILCRDSENDFLERQANRFAAQFLAPDEALTMWLFRRGIERVKSCDDVVHIAQQFNISYLAALRRLEHLQRLGRDVGYFKEELRPLKWAEGLGYPVSSYALGKRPLPLEQRFPRVAIELAHQITREGAKKRFVADLLGVDTEELTDSLERHDVSTLIEEDDFYQLI